MSGGAIGVPVIPVEDRGLLGLEKVHAALPVEMIMTPRLTFFSCDPNEPCEQVCGRNLEQYSFLPVMRDGKVLGLLDARRSAVGRYQTGLVSDFYEPLHEDMLIGADASLWQFIRTADNREVRLVVKGHAVAGLVSLSDLHKLPVRTALFTALTNLEICMTALIGERLDYDGTSWAGLLAPKRRALLECTEKRAREKDEFINRLVLTQFCDKREIVIKARLLDLPAAELRRSLKAVERLRNFVAHSNDFAQDEPMAREVCKTARSIEMLIDRMHQEFPASGTFDANMRVSMQEEPVG